MIRMLTGWRSLMPSLGAVLLIFAVGAKEGRWCTAPAAEAVASWITGVLCQALILIGADAWLAIRNGEPVSSSGSRADMPQDTRVHPIGIAATAISAVAIATIGI